MGRFSNTEIKEVDDTEGSKKRKGLLDLISIEEFPEGYFEGLEIHVNPMPGAIMMEASQKIMTIQEGIIEEVCSDKDESLERVESEPEKEIRLAGKNLP